MKVRASVKKRSAECKIVRRKGRVYIINFIAEDGKGGMCFGSAVVNVPHDQSDKSCPAVDSGQKYDATKIN